MIFLSFPIFLAAILLLLTLLTYLFRRWEQAVSVLTGLVCALLSLLLLRATTTDGLVNLLGGLLRVDMQAVVTRLGLTFQLTPTAVPILTLTLFLTALALLLNAATSQGRSFPPIALLTASGYGFLVLLTDAPVEPILLVPGLLALLASLGIYILQAGRLGKTLGPLRSLLPPLLAFPLFILATWYIDSLAINPPDGVAAAAAARLLGLGLLLLLAPAPFHSAGPAMAEDAPPIAVALLLLLYQLAALALLFRINILFPFVYERSDLSLWLTGAGLLTAVWGGLAAAGSSHPGRLWGYALLHDWGLILLLLASSDTSIWPLIVFLFALRIISVLAGAAGLAHLRRTIGSLDPDPLRGVGRSLPWSTLAYVLGGLGLAGFPLSAGFTGHWAALQTVAETDWRIATVVLLASGGVVVGFVRLIRIFYDPKSQPDRAPEGLFNALVAISAIVAASTVAVAPQLLDGPVDWVLKAFRL
ncbi:MAG: hypothetical protein WBO46_22560 [Caldilineaceae bacterium]